MWSTENTQTHQQEKTRVRFSWVCWISSTPLACCKSPSNISIITRQALHSRNPFLLTKVGDVAPCAWLCLVWMSRCHRHYRYKRNIILTSSRYFRCHSWIDFRTLGRVQNVTFSVCVCTSVSVRMKTIRKQNQRGAARSVVGWGHLSRSTFRLLSSISVLAQLVFSQKTRVGIQDMNIRLVALCTWCYTMSSVIKQGFQVHMHVVVVFY